MISMMLLVLQSSSYMLGGVVRGQVSTSCSPIMGEGGKGFGGGEATRDPEPTAIDPNDPKGKQQAIHKAEARTQHSNPRFLPRTFAAYLALPLQTVKGHAFESHARSHSPSIWPRDPQHQRQMALVLRRVTTRAPGCRPLRRRRSRRPLMP